MDNLKLETNVVKDIKMYISRINMNDHQMKIYDNWNVIFQRLLRDDGKMVLRGHPLFMKEVKIKTIDALGRNIALAEIFQDHPIYKSAHELQCVIANIELGNLNLVKIQL